VADAVAPERVHVPLNVPVLLVDSETVPVGVTNVPGEVSLIVTVHEAGLLASTDDVQEIAVEVVRGVTVIVFDVPELPL